MSGLPPLAPRGGSDGPIVGTGWDVCQLGGVILPGLWKVTAGGIRLKMDHKKKAGADGSNPVFHGLDPQAFAIEGFQWTNAQRDKLVDVCAQILPQPGRTLQQKPLLLQHPSVQHLGFAINVQVVGCGILEVIGPGRTRFRLELAHWMPDRNKGQSASNTPTQSTRSKITDDKAKQNPPNPTPDQLPGAAGPPINFTPGQ